MAAGSRGPELDAVIGVFLALTWIFTSLRVYVRLSISHNWGLDDTFLLLTLALYTTYSTSALLSVRYGSGQHPSTIPLTSIPLALKFYWLCELFYTLTTTFLRLSIAVFLLRICNSLTQKAIIWSTLAIVMTYSTFYFFLAIFQCSPVAYYWQKYESPDIQGHCIDVRVFPDATYAHAAVSAAADFVLSLVPVLAIWSLKMDGRTKASVAVVLCMGVIAGIAAIVRIPYVRVLGITDEFLYATVDVAIWSTIEPALGIIAASACVLRPLFKQFYHLSSSYGRGGGRGAGDGGGGAAEYGYETQASGSGSLPWHERRDPAPAGARLGNGNGNGNGGNGGNGNGNGKGGNRKRNGDAKQPIELERSKSARRARNSLGGPLGSHAVSLRSVDEEDDDDDDDDDDGRHGHGKDGEPGFGYGYGYGSGYGEDQWSRDREREAEWMREMEMQRRRAGDLDLAGVVAGFEGQGQRGLRQQQQQQWSGGEFESGFPGLGKMTRVGGGDDDDEKEEEVEIEGKKSFSRASSDEEGVMGLSPPPSRWSPGEGRGKGER